MARFIACLEVEAERRVRDGVEGYCFRDAEEGADDEPAWLSTALFESRYLPVGDDVPQNVIDSFIAGAVTVATADGSAAVYATLASGFDLVAAAEPGEVLDLGEIGSADLALRRIKERVRTLLRFVLRWARHGLAMESMEDSP